MSFGTRRREASEGLSQRTERLGSQIVDAGLAVHKALGPGLMESVYEHCLAYELQQRSLTVRRQVPLPVTYKGVSLDAGYRLDLVVDDTVIVEIKSVEAVSRLFEAQVLTYLRLSSMRLAFLMNFNVPLFKQGLRRYVR
ncbi:MAG TPA: GxxExxY protein [Caulobacteraceae bacterium]|nr:GxxExxY protein [Caulobacteraceae bacterium]